MLERQIQTSYSHVAQRRVVDSMVSEMPSKLDERLNVINEVGLLEVSMNKIEDRLGSAKIEEGVRSPNIFVVGIFTDEPEEISGNGKFVQR